MLLEKLLINCRYLERVPFLKVAGGGSKLPSEVYFPENPEIEKLGLPILEGSVARHSCTWNFLKKLGVKEYPPLEGMSHNNFTITS